MKVRQLPPFSAPRLSLTYISQSSMVSRASQNVGDVCVCAVQGEIAGPCVCAYVWIEEGGASGLGFS